MCTQLYSDRQTAYADTQLCAECMCTHIQRVRTQLCTHVYLSTLYELPVEYHGRTNCHQFLKILIKKAIDRGQDLEISGNP